MRPGDVRGRGGPEERVQECGSTHIYRACVRACVRVCRWKDNSRTWRWSEAQSTATGGQKAKD